MLIGVLFQSSLSLMHDSLFAMKTDPIVGKLVALGQLVLCWWPVLSLNYRLIFCFFSGWFISNNIKASSRVFLKVFSIVLISMVLTVRMSSMSSESSSVQLISFWATIWACDHTLIVSQICRQIASGQPCHILDRWDHMLYICFTDVCFSHSCYTFILGSFQITCQ